MIQENPLNVPNVTLEIIPRIIYKKIDLKIFLCFTTNIPAFTHPLKLRMQWKFAKLHFMSIFSLQEFK